MKKITEVEIVGEEVSSGPREKKQSFTAKNLPAKAKERDLIPIRRKKTDTETFEFYLKEVNKYPLLTLEQEKALTKIFEETGDLEVAKKLVTANLRLVVKIAMEYRYAYSNIMDLIQEGNIGLMKAVSKYDQKKGAKLSYYASWWIRSYILKFVLDNFHLVKIGTTNEQKKLFYNLMKEKERLVQKGETPTVKKISENLGVSPKTVALMDQRMAYGKETSLDKKVGQDENAATIGDLLPDQDIDPIDEVLAHQQGLKILKDNLQGFLEGLKERDREIFQNRLLSEIPMSLQAIADQYGVSRERIRQIEERLIKNLKVYMSDYLS